MSASSVRPFTRLAAVVFVAIAILTGAPVASAQSSITFTESMVPGTMDYSDSPGSATHVGNWAPD
ncbi:MAG: hypothetical protein HC841_09215 [Verrucomicrobiae bacterium]|nr:hypothetical protein [Verrucomicrobiae bacterium]